LYREGWISLTSTHGDGSIRRTVASSGIDSGLCLVTSKAVKAFYCEQKFEMFVKDDFTSKLFLNSMFHQFVRFVCLSVSKKSICLASVSPRDHSKTVC
jgi:hypothetical protein